MPAPWFSGLWVGGAPPAAPCGSAASAAGVRGRQRNLRKGPGAAGGLLQKGATSPLKVPEGTACQSWFRAPDLQSHAGVGSCCSKPPLRSCQRAALFPATLGREEGGDQKREQRTGAPGAGAGPGSASWGRHHPGGLWSLLLRRLAGGPGGGPLQGWLPLRPPSATRDGRPSAHHARGLRPDLLSSRGHRPDWASCELRLLRRRSHGLRGWGSGFSV